MPKTFFVKKLGKRNSWPTCFASSPEHPFSNSAYFAKTGHFYFGKKRTFLFWVDIGRYPCKSTQISFASHAGNPPDRQPSRSRSVRATTLAAWRMRAPANVDSRSERGPASPGNPRMMHVTVPGAVPGFTEFVVVISVTLLGLSGGLLKLALTRAEDTEIRLDI